MEETPKFVHDHPKGQPKDLPKLGPVPAPPETSPPEKKEKKNEGSEPFVPWELDPRRSSSTTSSSFTNKEHMGGDLPPEGDMTDEELGEDLRKRIHQAALAQNGPMVQGLLDDLATLEGWAGVKGTGAYVDRQGNVHSAATEATQGDHPRGEGGKPQVRVKSLPIAQYAGEEGVYWVKRGHGPAQKCRLLDGHLVPEDQIKEEQLPQEDRLPPNPELLDQPTAPPGSTGAPQGVKPRYGGESVGPMRFNDEPVGQTRLRRTSEMHQFGGGIDADRGEASMGTSKEPDLWPDRKITAGLGGGVVGAHLIAFAYQQLTGTEMPPVVAIDVAVIMAAVVGYLVPRGNSA